MEFENKVYEGIHYSRFIASWYNAGGGNINDWRNHGRETFKNFLRTLTINGKPIPEEVIYEIAIFATNGKLELETSAKAFIKAMKAE